VAQVLPQLQLTVTRLQVVKQLC